MVLKSLWRIGRSRGVFSASEQLEDIQNQMEKNPEDTEDLVYLRESPTWKVTYFGGGWKGQDLMDSMSAV